MAVTKAPKPPTSPRLAIGRARAHAARAHIQRALVELGYAQADLFSLYEVHRDVEDLRKMVERLKAVFYRMEHQLAAAPKKKAKRHYAELDHDPNHDEQANPHNGGCGQRSWKASY